MRKILLLLLLCLGAAKAVVIDECKLDLYYANGIMMQDSAEQAEDKWRARVDDLLQKHPNHYRHIGNIGVAYNISHGMVADMWAIEAR